MSLWILRKKGSVTAKELAKLIGCRSSWKYLPKKRKTFIINYGTNYPFANLNVNVDTNKLNQLSILKENGFLVPDIYLKGAEIPDNAFPLLTRKKFHSKGRDICYIENREQFDNEIGDMSYDYLTKYIRKKKEYRVHILGDYASFVSVKIKDKEYEEPNVIVRSKDNGWLQIEYKGEWKDSLIETARLVIKTLKLDFGAVDIIRSRNNKLYVLEVNTAPGLEDRKLQLYADYFQDAERNKK